MALRRISLCSSERELCLGVHSGESVVLCYAVLWGAVGCLGGLAVGCQKVLQNFYRYGLLLQVNITGWKLVQNAFDWSRTPDFDFRMTNQPHDE